MSIAALPITQSAKYFEPDQNALYLFRSIAIFVNNKLRLFDS